MKEASDKSHKDNSCGVVAVVFGILSLIFILIPFIGLTMGIVGVIFAYKQKKMMHNKWSKAGLWMCWIGVVIGFIWSVYYVKLMISIAQQYAQLAQLQGAGAAGGIDLAQYGAN